jgi:hypothetical protein
MAVSLKCAKHTYTFPEEFPEAKNLLVALDQFRSGFIRGGLAVMGICCPDEVRDDYHVMDYEDNPEQFKIAMRRIVRNLKKVGL